VFDILWISITEFVAFVCKLGPIPKSLRGIPAGSKIDLTRNQGRLRETATPDYFWHELLLVSLEIP
jgi:hypothetical protein